MGDDCCHLKRLSLVDALCVHVGKQAQATQDANRAASNRMPPIWAIAAMVVLGFNEFLALLYNPFYIVLGIALFLFGRTVYQARS